MDDSSLSGSDGLPTTPTLASILGVKGPIRIRPHKSKQKAHVVLRRVEISNDSSDEDDSPRMVYFGLFAHKRIEVKPGKEILVAIASATGRFKDKAIMFEAPDDEAGSDEEDAPTEVAEEPPAPIQVLHPKMARRGWGKTGESSAAMADPPKDIQHSSIGVQAEVVVETAAVQTDIIVTAPPVDVPKFKKLPPTAPAADRKRQLSLLDTRPERKHQVNRSKNFGQAKGRSLTPMELDSPKASPSESPRYSPKAADVIASLPAIQPPVRAISVASSDDMLVSPIESPQTRIIDLTVSQPVTPSNAPPPETSSLDLPHPEQGIIDMFALPPSPQKPHPSEPISAPPTFKRPPIKNPFVSGGFVTEFVGSMPELETPKVVAASIVPLEKPHTNGQTLSESEIFARALATTRAQAAQANAIASSSKVQLPAAEITARGTTSKSKAKSSSSPPRSSQSSRFDERLPSTTTDASSVAAQTPPPSVGTLFQPTAITRGQKRLPKSLSFKKASIDSGWPESRTPSNANPASSVGKLRHSTASSHATSPSSTPIITEAPAPNKWKPITDVHVKSEALEPSLSWNTPQPTPNPPLIPAPPTPPPPESTIRIKPEPESPSRSLFSGLHVDTRSSPPSPAKSSPVKTSVSPSKGSHEKQGAWSRPAATPVSATQMTHPLPPRPVQALPRGVKRERAVSPDLRDTMPTRQRRRSLKWPTVHSFSTAQLKGEGNLGIKGIHFNSTGALFALNCEDKTIRVWNSHSRSEMARLGHLAPLVSVAWMAGDSGVISLGEDGVVSKWTRTGTNHWQWARVFDAGREQLADGDTICMAFFHDRIAISYPRGGVKVWFWQKGSWQPQRSINRQSVSALAFVDDGTALVGGTRDGVVWFCEIPNGTLRAYGFLKAKITAIDVNPNNTHVVVALANGVARLLNIGSGQKTVQQRYSSFETESEGRVSFGALFAAHGQGVIFGSVDGCALIWDTKKGAIVYGLEHMEDDIIKSVASYSTNKDGCIVTGTSAGRLYWWSQPASNVRGVT